jgi:hypothetical protein
MDDKEVLQAEEEKYLLKVRLDDNPIWSNVSLTVDARQLRHYAVTEDEEWLLSMNPQPTRQRFKDRSWINWQQYPELAKQWRSSAGRMPSRARRSSRLRFLNLTSTASTAWSRS